MERILASGGDDHEIRLWLTADGKVQGVLAKSSHPLSALNFSPDGQLLITGNFTPPRPNQLDSIYLSKRKSLSSHFKGHDNLVIATAFHPNGQWVATGGGDHKEVLLWRANDGEILSRLEGRGRTIYAVGFSRDGRYISWGQTHNWDETRKILNLNDRGSLEKQFDLGEIEPVNGGLGNTEFIRAQERVGEVSLFVRKVADNRLEVKKGRKRICTIERGQSEGLWHNAYTLTPDGRHILSGAQNGDLRIYSLDGKTEARLIGHTGTIMAVAISADGHWALSGANDQTLKLWDLEALKSRGNKQILPTLSLFPIHRRRVGCLDAGWVFCGIPQWGKTRRFQHESGS